MKSLYRFQGLFSLIFVIPAILFAQEMPQRRGSKVIDDSTKQVYGPKTSLYYYEMDYFYNKVGLNRIDTIIRDFQAYSYVQKNKNLYQDLGNIGTAIRPIYFQVPETIGATSGFQAYDMYWDTEKVRYFDTKSPYTNLNVILGGKGRSITRVAFSRSVNSRWNFGLLYRGLFIDKQILRQGKGDRHVKNNYYHFHTSYFTKDSVYTVLANFRRGYHMTDEYGGVEASSPLMYNELFLKNARPILKDAESRDLRMNFHLYHQFKIGKGLQVYHILDRYRQGTQFLDKKGAAPAGYFDYLEIDSIKTRDETLFKVFRNEAGIKGSLLKLFYNGYYAYRQFDMDYLYIHEDSLKSPAKGLEHYLGGRMSLNLDSLMELSGWAEMNQLGNYRIEGSVKSPWLSASVKQMEVRPPQLFQAYRGSHDLWDNDFKNIQVSEIKGNLAYTSKILEIKPGITFTRVNNLVYFKKDTSNLQDVLPVQSAGNQVFILPELNFRLTLLKHIHILGQGIYSLLPVNDGDAFQVPSLLVNAQLSYANIFFNGNCDMHAGVDVHWKSSYFTPGYDLPIQQFYVQKDYVSPVVPIVDIFLNIRIKTGKVFFKYHNITKVFNPYGYIPTPGYPGQINVFDFGFDWSFYD